jgi:hypothetical protein
MPQITADATSLAFGGNKRGNGAYWLPIRTTSHHIEPFAVLGSAADLSDVPWL